jgi:hypothetical protein
MNQPRNVPQSVQAAADHHPSGTLAIVAIYAFLFVGGWLAMYLFVFLSRGHVTP